MSVIGKIKFWVAIAAGFLSYPLVSILPISDYFKGIVIIAVAIAAYIVLGIAIKKLGK